MRWALVALVCASSWVVLGSAVPATTAAPTDAGKSVLRGAFGYFPDYLDPQLSYSFEGWMAMYDTYIPLLTFTHADGLAGSKVIPGLARHLPRISHDGKTYVLFLRRGLKYSNGRPVKSSDFKHAIERLFRVFSGGAPLYRGIVGAKRFSKTRRGGIKGIETDDRTGRIAIHLVRPENDFSVKLALIFAAPVPGNTPAADRTAAPPPATGPYAITSVRPGLGWSYARNPEWASNNARLMRRIPGGHVDRIEMRVIRSGQEAVQKVGEGKLDWVLDPEPVQPLEDARRRYPGTQLRTDPLLSTYYFWMNTTRPPFNDVRVRRAVDYAISPATIRRIYEGGITPTQQILPPGMPGYRRLDLYPYNLAKARRLVARANPSDRSITVWTDSEEPNRAAGAYYAQVLRSLGFHARLKVAGFYSYFFAITNPKTPNLDIGWSDWYEDYPHPNDFLSLFSGRSISSGNNLSRIDVPALNRRIASLARRRGPIPSAGYARLERSIMKRAPVAPLGYQTLSSFGSKSLDLRKVAWNPTFGDDLTSFRLK